jgi:hypothetical protein
LNTIHEQFKAQAQVVPDSLGTRLRNAAIEGYRTATDSLLSIVLFFLSAGPALLLWIAILLVLAAIFFLPARLSLEKEALAPNPITPRRSAGVFSTCERDQDHSLSLIGEIVTIGVKPFPQILLSSPQICAKPRKPFLIKTCSHPKTCPLVLCHSLK